MGVYIKNKDMPKSCGECEFNYNLEGGSYEWWECAILHDDINQFDTRRTDCPLIDIVTCGECKWSYIDEQYEGTLWCKVHFHHYLVNSDGFCNYGERANNT